MTKGKKKSIGSRNFQLSIGLTVVDHSLATNGGTGLPRFQRARPGSLVAERGDPSPNPNVQSAFNARIEQFPKYLFSVIL